LTTGIFVSIYIRPVNHFGSQRRVIHQFVRFGRSRKSAFQSSTESRRHMVRKVIVLGGGSAGFIAAITLKRKIPHLQVTVFRSKEIGIIGVGEGANAGFAQFLHDYLEIRPSKFLEMAQPTWKLGLKFIWGRRDYFNFTFSFEQLIAKPQRLPKIKAFYCWDDLQNEDVYSAMMSADRVFGRNPAGQPVFHNQFSYHFENEKLVGFLEHFASALGISIIEDTVSNVERGEQGIAGLRFESGRHETADLYIDASGFASVLLGKAMEEPFQPYSSSLFCDRAVVGGWNRSDPADMVIKPYTTCETMNAGWSWQIEHEHRINRGYVYSSAFISDTDAETEFRQKNPRISRTRIVRFVSGRYRNFWVKNVFAVGNAGGFVEPLEATALGGIGAACRSFTNILLECDCEPTPFAQRQFNKAQGTSWDDIRDFLTVHYKFNNRLDTPFWRHCWNETDLAGAREIVNLYLESGPVSWMRQALPIESGFGPAGYVVLLTGQKVNYSCHRPAPEADMQVWRAEQSRMRGIALQGLRVRETLNAIRSEQKGGVSHTLMR